MTEKRQSWVFRQCLVAVLVGLLPLVAGHASEDVFAIIVRFTEAEVAFPEADYEETAPLDAVSFQTDALRATLKRSGVFALTLVCPEWRHLEGPQYDIHGHEVELVDFTDVYKLEGMDSCPGQRFRKASTRFLRLST